MPWPMRLGPQPRIMTFLRVGGLGLALALVGGVEVRGEALELGGAGIHAIEDGGDAQRLALRAHREFGRSFQARAERLSEKPSRLARQLFAW